jgi:hypothetical protein
MTRSTWRTLGAVAAAAVVLSACTDNQSDSDAIAVSATEDQCDVDVAEVGSGNTSFATRDHLRPHGRAPARRLLHGVQAQPARAQRG